MAVSRLYVDLSGDSLLLLLGRFGVPRSTTFQ